MSKANTEQKQSTDVMTAETSPGLLDMLCRSFNQDPHINWMVRQDAFRDRAMRSLFSLLLDPSRGGQLQATPDQNAAALWFPPNGEPMGITHDLAFFFPYIGIAGWVAALPKSLRLQQLRTLRPTVPHYYLQLLAVAPEHQGEGLGSALLGDLTIRCDQEGLPIYVETSREENVRFYARHGFQVTARTPLSATLTLLSLLRTPHDPGRA